jgi:hypothetical protein
MIKSLRLDPGEADVFRLYRSGRFDGISSDNGRFIRIMDGLGVPCLTPSALVVNLFHRCVIERKQAARYMAKLKELISEEEYHLAMDAIGGG